MTPSDADVDRLSSAVDRAFAERDRLWATRGVDDPAATHQEERAVQLLDRYNAAVAAQMAESERHRTENLARYQAERDETWMTSSDAARPPQSLPPPAEPYVPRTAPTTGGTMSNVEEAQQAIMSAHSSGESSLAQLQAAHSDLESTQNGLREATQGSNQPEADQAHAQLADAMNKIDEARQQVAAALSEFAGVARRL